MERIKQALEAARKSRNESLAATSAKSDGGPAGITRAESGVDFKYTKTETFKPNREVLTRNRIVTVDEANQETGAFKMLRTQVLQRMIANRWNALAVTSPSAGEGKTVITVNLAIALALEVNYTVLLVDLDLRNPKVHTAFGYEPKHGLSDYIFDDVPVSSMLFNPGFERLVVLPAGHTVMSSSEVLASPKMSDLVTELKNRYPSRFVLFDLPPVLAADDTLAFSPYVDTVLLVVEEDGTTRDELKAALDLLKGYNVIGTVLNKSKRTQAAMY
jgi:protein-tyrosine kinase